MIRILAAGVHNLIAVVILLLALAAPTLIGMQSVGVSLFVLAYFAPTLIAALRANERQIDFAPILGINLFLGFTLFGWVWALARALSAAPPRARAAGPASSASGRAPSAEPRPLSRYCGDCGAPLDGTKFCRSCGARV